MKHFPLASAFQSARPESSRAPADADLEKRLESVVQIAVTASASWSRGEDFAAFLGERLENLADLERVPVADLYLACASLRGVPDAVAALHRSQAPAVEAALRRLGLPPDRVDEVRGRLFERLLLPGETGSAPLLARYRGTGAMSAWLRVVATREGLTSLRARDDTAETDEEGLASLEEDLELSFVKESCRAAFKAAFGEAVLSLPVRERTLLKQHYLDGLSARDIGRMRRVHHATVARWLDEVRERVFARTRAALHDRLQVGTEEFESMIRLLQSRWDVTVGRFLDPAGRSSASSTSK